jgi:hypothetical protein
MANGVDSLGSMPSLLQDMQVVVVLLVVFCSMNDNH